MSFDPYRRALAAYAASAVVIGGLFAIVALGGSAVAPKQNATFSSAQLVAPGR